MAWGPDQREWAQHLVWAASAVRYVRDGDLESLNKLLALPEVQAAGGGLFARVCELVVYAVQQHGGDPDTWIDQASREALEIHLRSEE